MMTAEQLAAYREQVDAETWAWLGSTLWGRRWRQYGECWYCQAAPGWPCEDRRWDGRHSRWCRRPHPERKHTRLPLGATIA